MRKILLHTCCGPCATSSIETLLNNDIRPTLFFDNPNIAPNDERELRRENLHTVAKHYGVDVIDGFTLHSEFLNRVSGLEDCKEGGDRCLRCFLLNAELTEKASKEHGFDSFCTTLTVSRFKNTARVWGEFSKLDGFEKIDFKKNAGFERSCKLSKELGLYRQHYCGCEFSMSGS